MPDHLPKDRAGLPEGERALQEAWRAKYAPEVKELIVRREVPSPKLTLIIISYKAKDYLIECLQHARGQTAALDVPYEILLADSGGIEHLRPRSAPLVDVELRLTDGIPLNAARNAAIAWARGEYVAFIDDDGLIAPTFVEVVCRVFQDARIAAMRGRIIPKEHPYFCTLAGHYDRGDDVIDDVLATEGHMAIRRGVYLETGGFPDQFYGAEGVYLVYRIAKAFPDMRVVYVPDLLMRHDYFDSWENFIWKTRKYRRIRREVGGMEPDPEFLRYLDDYLARRKPQRPLTAEQTVALGLLKAVRWGVLRLPGWAVGQP
ncbi:glycosyltransferase family 2 protein [Sorangium cellulosum]|uniref:Glycosyltransferase n=3 Tax=Sorangium cellulosum TaxID=56 RepID=A0A150TLZ3_SORCE|nr:glycosyltransferase [Sorangium cellulosum]AGP35698.1 hypothetical protein SCE1572_14905 [Sorangium cellulosum So0157-2]KYG05704.1 glycosyltransferase [Sorangium cellulosum]